MGNDLYTLRKKGIMLVYPNGCRRPVYFLQLAVQNALSQDSQNLVDIAIKDANKTWAWLEELPQLAIQVGYDAIPRPGSPIFEWKLGKRVYCFDHELVRPIGYLGEREINGFLFRTVEEQKQLDDLVTASNTHKATAEPYFHFRFESRYPNNRKQYESKPSPRLIKVLSLIRLIESKGKRASRADLQYLGCLREKASQLGGRAQCR